MKKILLIMPDAHMHKVQIGSFKKSMREAPLTLTTLASLVGRTDVEIRIVDESIDSVPHNFNADLVGISVLTGTACRAYRFAEHYRNKGVHVVLGGPHVTILPKEAKLYADTIVVGMAERTWPKLINDFLEGTIQKVYSDIQHEKEEWLCGIPAPRTDLQRRSGYVLPDTVQATRGCKRRCDFCSVSAVWKKFYKRPVGEVIRDIKSLPGSRIAINDVSLVDDVEYAKELFSAMIPLKKKWGGLATVDVGNDDELLDIMHKSGCRYLLIGFETFDESSLQRIRKGFNKPTEYEVLMKKLHEKNISVQGTIVFGFDEDTKDVFKNTVESVQRLKIDIPRYSIFTPYPGTTAFAKLHKEKRIISTNWEDYDTMHVVYKPKLMSVSELYEGFKWAYKETFRVNRIFERLGPRVNLNTLINGVGNLTYKIFVKRLYHEERYAKSFGFVDTRPL